MNSIIRIMKPPSEPMPELGAFLKPFHVRFARNERPQAPEPYLTGLLTDLPNMNCGTIPSPSEQRLQCLLMAMIWDGDELKASWVKRPEAVESECIIGWSLLVRTKI